MKKLIFVAGDLASGKTRFSEMISQRFGIPVIHKDPIKEILGDTIGFSSREENKKLSEASRSIMALFLEEYVKTGENLIMESNFRKDEIKNLSAEASEYGYETLTLYLTGDVNVLHKRYVYRITSENRHPVHQSTTFDIFEDFKHYVESTRFEPDGNAIVVDATDFSYQTSVKILNAVEIFITHA